MKLFGINITFIDRSGEEDAIKMMQLNELQDQVYEWAPEDGSIDDLRSLIAEKESLRQEMINRGYLDED